MGQQKSKVSIAHNITVLNDKESIVDFDVSSDVDGKKVTTNHNSYLVMELVESALNNRPFDIDKIKNAEITDLNHQNSAGQTILHCICDNADKFSDSSEIVTELIEREMDVNLVDSKGLTALAILCSKSPTAKHIAAKLIEYEKTDVNKGDVPLNEVSFNKPNKAPLAILLKNRRTLDLDTLEMFKLLVQCKRTDVNTYIDGNKTLTPLMYLCCRAIHCQRTLADSKEYIKILIQMKNVINSTLVTSREEWNALSLSVEYSDESHWRCHDCYYVEYHSSTQIVELLINDKKCNINHIYSGRCDSILMKAIRWRHTCSLNTIKLLIEKSNINLQDIDKNTALHIACSEKYHDAILLFKDAKNKHGINMRNKNGDTPLHIACLNDDIIAVKNLLAINNCNVNIKNNDGDTPVHIVASSLSTEKCKLMKLLLNQKSCRVNRQNNKGETALMVCAKTCFQPDRNDSDDDNTDNSDDNKQLKCNCTSKYCEKSIDLLLSTAKINIQIKDKLGKTVLLSACKHSKRVIRDAMLDILLSKKMTRKR